jgi:hypothetical protein
VTIEIRYWWDADHTEPARMAIFRRYSGLRAVAIGGDPGENDARVIPISLPRVSRTAYRGEVVFPDARRFRIAWCGGGYDRRGYPLARGVAIVPREAVGQDTPDRTAALLLTWAGGAVVVAGSFWVVRTRTAERVMRTSGRARRLRDGPSIR